MASVSKKVLVNSALTAASTVSDVQSLDQRQWRFVAFLSVTACDAATTVDVRLEHSSDKSTWFEFVNFTDIVGTTGSELIYEKNFTGGPEVLANVRAKVLLSGVTKSATVKVELCYDEHK